MTTDSTPSPLTIVFMGDSITEGQYVDHALRWTDRLTQRINTKRVTPHLFYNRGISGQTTRQGLERFAADVQNMQPDIMTLQFGLNDCNHWDSDRGLPRVSESAYKANMIEMIERARHFGTKHIILSTNHPTLRHKPLAGGKTLEENRLRYNAIVREIACDTSVTLCDIDHGFAHFSPNELAEMLLPEPDVLHLSPKGHIHYENLIYPFLMNALR